MSKKLIIKRCENGFSHDEISKIVQRVREVQRFNIFPKKIFFIHYKMCVKSIISTRTQAQAMAASENIKKYQTPLSCGVRQKRKGDERESHKFSSFTRLCAEKKYKRE